MNSQLVRDFNKVGTKNQYEGEFVPIAVEGAKELDILCPVLKSTGFRGSFVDAITIVSDKNSRLAEALTVELPPIVSSSDISDTDKLRLLASRLDTGSFSENDNLADALARVAKEFMPQADVETVVNEAQVNADKGELQSIVDNV